jgi:hypothetical protein
VLEEMGEPKEMNMMFGRMIKEPSMPMVWRRTGKKAENERASQKWQKSRTLSEGPSHTLGAPKGGSQALSPGMHLHGRLN